MSRTTEVCVHGDAHLGNIMWHRGELRLIDFDMTAVGPAGADLAYIVLMLQLRLQGVGGSYM